MCDINLEETIEEAIGNEVRCKKSGVKKTREYVMKHVKQDKDAIGDTVITLLIVLTLLRVNPACRVVIWGFSVLELASCQEVNSVGLLIPRLLGLLIIVYEADKDLGG